MSIQKPLNQILVFLNLYQQAKNNFIPLAHSCDTVNFRVPWPDWPQPLSSLNISFFKARTDSPIETMLLRTTDKIPFDRN